MLSLITTVLLLVCMIINNDPRYAIAAGLFEIAGVIHSITRPRRLTAPKKNEGVEENDIHRGGLY